MRSAWVQKIMIVFRFFQLFRQELPEIKDLDKHVTVVAIACEHTLTWQSRSTYARQCSDCNLSSWLPDDITYSARTKHESCCKRRGILGLQSNLLKLPFFVRTLQEREVGTARALDKTWIWDVIIKEGSKTAVRKHNPSNPWECWLCKTIGVATVVLRLSWWTRPRWQTRPKTSGGHEHYNSSPPFDDMAFVTSYSFCARPIASRLTRLWGLPKWGWCPSPPVAATLLAPHSGSTCHT